MENHDSVFAKKSQEQIEIEERELQPSDRGARLTVVDHIPSFSSGPLSYQIGLANFGHAVDFLRRHYHAVIVKEPHDGWLCEFRKADMESVFEEIPEGKQHIMLMVRLDISACDLVTMASTAMRIQKEVLDEFRYMLFHNAGWYNRYSIPTLTLEESLTIRKLEPITKTPSSNPTVSPTTSSVSPTLTPTTVPPTEPIPSFSAEPTSITTEDLTTSLTFFTTFNDTVTDDELLTGNSEIVLGNETSIDDEDEGDISIDEFEEETSNDEFKDETSNDEFEDETSNDDGLDEILEEQKRQQERQEAIDELSTTDGMVFLSISAADSEELSEKMYEDRRRFKYRYQNTNTEQWYWRPSMVLEGPHATNGYNFKRFDDDYYNTIFDQVASNYETDDSLPISTPNPNDKYPDSYAKNAPGSFEILKFVLFGLLIISPCLRAIHLWYAGGGRVVFRLSHDDRIVGLEYVPPAENWFGGGGYEAPEGERPHRRLTREEVMSLPEITYQKPKFDDCDDAHTVESSSKHIYNENDDNSENEEDAQDTKDGVGDSNQSGKLGEDSSLTSQPVLTPVSSELNLFSRSKQELPTSPERVISTSVSSADRDGSESKRTSPSTASSIGSREEIPADELSTDEEQPLSFRAQRRLRAFTTTTCTTCSICIDEFEEGETIRLLPRCGHAFHTECILPWLKDRQGCCPLCKMGVLDTDDGNNNDSSEDTRDNGDNDNGTDGNSPERAQDIR